MAIKPEEQESEQGFVQRWSKRKRESTSDVNNNLENNNIIDHAISESITADSEPLVHKTDADMLPLEQLNEGSDYSDFLSPDVSHAVRKLALRKLFHLPLFNIVDGLDDYAEDFTKFTPLGDIIPHEMKRMLERERRKELEDLEEHQEQQHALKKYDELNEDVIDNDTIDDAEKNDKNLPLSNINKDDIEVSPATKLINLKNEDDNEKLN